jgi:hypothetical protein
MAQGISMQYLSTQYKFMPKRIMPEVKNHEDITKTTGLLIKKQNNRTFYFGIFLGSTLFFRCFWTFFDNLTGAIGA